MKRRLLAVLIGVALALLPYLGLSATSGNAVQSRYDSCASCGASLVSTSILGVSRASRIEETPFSRWMLSLAPPGHEHSWVYSHTTMTGWRTHGIGCALTEEDRLLTLLRMAHERLGDDQELASVVREFLLVDERDLDRRREIASRTYTLHLPDGALPRDTEGETPPHEDVGGALLDDVPELQRIARMARSGALGCGMGTIAVITSEGPVELQSGLDPIHVFGDRVAVADLLALLRARASASRSGEGPMSGEVDDLFYVIFLVLRDVADPVSVGPIAALLEDYDEEVGKWACVALLRIGEKRPELRPRIRDLLSASPALSAAGPGSYLDSLEWMQER